MSVATAWVKPSHSITGQDHLGVRAPCEGIYKQLLPGITNVTDRARYYSFYPWLLWAFEQHDGKLKRKPFFHTLRRAASPHRRGRGERGTLPGVLAVVAGRGR